MPMRIGVVSAKLLLRSTAVDNGIEATAAGSWTVSQAQALEQLVDEMSVGVAKARALTIDMRDVTAFDTFGACLLDRLLAAHADGNVDGQRSASVIGLQERFSILLSEVQRANSKATLEAQFNGRLRKSFRYILSAVVDVAEDALALIAMFGAIGYALLRVLVRPGSVRLTSAVHHLDRVGWQAIPIITLITFLIGAIIAQQGIFHFRKFGADDYAVDLVGILVLREIGVLLVAIMVAGRSGSAYTAELGSMKMREEIDALCTMGLDPIEVLVLPRVIALVCGLPILTFIGSIAALYGGGLVAWLYGGMSPAVYVARLRDAVTVTHFEVGMIKAPFMGLMIGVVACVEGFKVQGSAESLGLQTTASVVRSIFLVILLDGLFAMFFASIGM